MSYLHSRVSKTRVLILGHRRASSNEEVHNFVGDSSDEFTIEVNHVGIFVGFGKLRSYVLMARFPSLIIEKQTPGPLYGLMILLKNMDM
jgi:hypothetical protein